GRDRRLARRAHARRLRGCWGGAVDQPAPGAEARERPGPPRGGDDAYRLREGPYRDQEGRPHGAPLGPRARDDAHPARPAARALQPLPARARAAGRRDAYRRDHRRPCRPAPYEVAPRPLPRPRPRPRGPPRAPPPRPLAQGERGARPRPRRRAQDAAIGLRGRARARHRRLGGAHAPPALHHLQQGRGGGGAPAVRGWYRGLDGAPVDGVRARHSRRAGCPPLREGCPGSRRARGGVRGVVRARRDGGGRLPIL
ncbi:MAG: Nickel transporter UreH, partial [uncultured Rubrobacteraceae bacterium]